MRATGTKAVQAERHELAQMAEAQPVFYKSSRRRYRSKYAHDWCDTHLHNGTHWHYSPDLTLRYFCACSATIVRWLSTWGVAPGFILLRLQRAMLTRGHS